MSLSLCSAVWALPVHTTTEANLPGRLDLIVCFLGPVPALCGSGGARDVTYRFPFAVIAFFLSPGPFLWSLGHSL